MPASPGIFLSPRAYATALGTDNPASDRNQVLGKFGPNGSLALVWVGAQKVYSNAP